MSIGRELTEQISQTYHTFGKTLANILFPRDFEVYMCGLELTDFDGNTIDYFIFPVTPDSIQKIENERITFVRTFGGITILDSDSYTPGQLSISGSFGRNFKLLLRNKENLTLSFKGLRFSKESGVYSANDVNSKFRDVLPDFMPTIKTGFGCIKILQTIINKAKGNDNGRPFRLYFYNPALSEDYLVIPTKSPLQLSQDINSSNMVWKYSLSLDIVSPLENIIFDDKEKTRIGFLVGSTIQKYVNDTARKAMKF